MTIMIHSKCVILPRVHGTSEEAVGFLKMSFWALAVTHNISEGFPGIDANSFPTDVGNITNYVLHTYIQATPE